MKTWKKMLVSAVGVMTMAMVLAGCGSSEKTAEVPKTLRVGTEATYPPFEFAKEGSNEIQGFDVDIMNEVAKRIGTKVEWHNMGFDALIPGLKSKQLDAAIAGINVTPEREKAVAFSTPYYETASVVVHKEGDGITTTADLKGKVVAAQIGTTGADVARELVGDKAKDFNYVPDILNELKVGGASAAIIDKPIALYYMTLDKGQFAEFSAGTPSEPVAIAMNMDNKVLVEKVNQALADMKADGTYNKIQEKWFGKAE